MRATLLLLPILPLTLSGCVSTLATVVTAPVKIASKAADLATTSQSEADEKRGRALRKREEQVGKLARQRDKAQKKCDNGDREQCARVEVLEHEIEAEMARSL
jgi:uncharacterized protein YlxW (UPF0749 family)